MSGGTGVRTVASVGVAVCAYSLARWDRLVECLEAITPQLGDGDECVLVIDHNEELYARAVAAWPGVRVLRNEESPGVSGARNSAIAGSRRDVVAFLDDDAVAGPDWLERVRTAFAEPDVMVVGTAAAPMWPTGARPGWLPPEFDWVVGCTYRGLPTVRADVRNVIGVAMAFRRQVFDRVGGFSPAVGRVGTRPTGCDETELCIRLRQADPAARVVFLPDVAVAHHVTVDRTRWRYFVRRCRGEGRSKAWVSRLVGAGDGLSSERAYLLSVLPRAVVREVGRGLRGHGSGWAAAGAIVVGVAMTGSAYALGRVIPARELAAPPRVGTAGIA
jgi:GT2 family glycosyltransferase